MTMPSSSTKISPVTESTVSIRDQDLMVWPMESPKYSLTSQKPASLTWEKNTEPEPMASTTKGGLTLAQPVDQPEHQRRSGDRRDGRGAGGETDQHGDHPGKEQHRDVRALGPLGEQGADAGVDQHLLEPTAGRDDEQDAGDRRQRGRDGAADLLLVHAGALAEGEHGHHHGDQQRDE